MDSDPRNSASEQTPHRSDSSPSPAPPSSQGDAKGRWTWPTRGGYRVGAGRPCPICAGDSNCQVAEEGAILCSRPPSNCARKGTRITASTGQVYASGRVSTGASTAGFQMFLPVDAEGRVVTAPTLTPDQLAAAEADREKGRQVLSKLSLDTFARGVPEHAMVRYYLAGRGIEKERLPGGRIPPAIRWVPDAPGFPAWRDGKLKLNEPRGAMCALVMRASEGDDRKVRGLHMTYLVGTPPKVLKADRPRAWCGSCDGVARLGQRVDDVPGGVLLVGEGLETTLAGMAGTGYVGWAWLSADRLTTFELHADVCKAGATGVPLVHTLVLMGDLDKVVDRRGRRSKKGQTKTAEAAAIARARYPWLTVVERFPTPDVAGELVRVATDQDEHCEPGEPVPAAADRGVDWDDVIKLTGGPGRVRKGLLDGVDLEANARHAAAWWAEHGATWRDPGPPAQPASPPRSIADTSEKPVHARPRTAPTRLTPASPLPASGGGGKLSDDGHAEFVDAVGEAPGDLVTCEGVPEEEMGFWWKARADKSEEWTSVISPRGIDRARLFLMRKFRPRKGEGWCLTLATWGGKWFSYEAGIWTELAPGSSQDGFPDVLKASVSHWLGRWRSCQVRKDGEVSIGRVNPSENAVREICAKISYEVRIEADRMCVWIPEMLDENGVPDWGNQRNRKARSVHPQMGSAEDFLVDAKGIIPLNELVEMWAGRREVVTRFTHSPHLFTYATRSFEIPLDRVCAAIHLKDWPREAFDDVCPTWGRMLYDATDADPKPLRQSRLNQLGLMFGETLGSRRDIEKVYLVTGARRSFKTTIAEGLVACMGEHTMAVLNLEDLLQSNGPAALVGKQAMLAPDVEIGQKTDTSVLSSRLKQFRGNDWISVRDLYRPFAKVKLGCRPWIFANDMPTKLRDSSGAFAGSLVIWPTTRSVYGQEDSQVKRLVATEGAGIAAWAMYHYAKLYSMARPAIVVSELAQEQQDLMEAATSLLTDFLHEVIEPTTVDGRPVLRPIPNSFTPFATIYEGLYVKWCERENREAIRKTDFAARLYPLIPGVRHLRRTWQGRDNVTGFDGIKLRAEAILSAGSQQAAAAGTATEPPRGYAHEPDDPFPLR